MRKTVFISSTYQDLADHRRAVWQVLEGFDVAVRGMEDFGARTEGPLETCLAEVEQSDVYIGIAAFRLGSVDAKSGKSFTQLEYEHALQLKKEILIYLADEQVARVRYTDIDVDPLHHEKLNAFKRILRERHTVNSFSSPEDLAEKLKRDFARYFESREVAAEQPQEEFTETVATVGRFLLMPKSAVGREIRLRVSFLAGPYPAARGLCNAFHLDYGSTIGIRIKVVAPEAEDMTKFRELYASGKAADQLLRLHAQEGAIDLYSRLQFSEEDVRKVRAEFFGYTTYWEPEPEDPYEQYVPPEGKVILLFSKPAP